MNILCGYQKVGNNWCRFVLFNYYNILNNNAKETLTWKELDEINPQRLEFDQQFPFKKGFPEMVHTHLAFDGQGLFQTLKGRFKNYNKLIYLYRNPFDTMVSHWFWMKERDNPLNGVFRGDKLKEVLQLKGFINEFLPKYIHHVNTTMKHADLVLCYDELRKYPLMFRSFISAFEPRRDRIKEEVLKQAIEMSSFESIKKMTEREGTPFKGKFKLNFCRDGRTGQFREVMSKELIRHVRKEWRDKVLCKN